MWTLDSPVPEFCVRTRDGTVGPADLRGRWVVLMHCAAPSIADCDACLDRFDLLAQRLAERGCVLLVAIDTPGRALEERLASRVPGQPAGPLVGTWVATAMPPAHPLRFALVDPDGVLRAFDEFARERAFAEWDVLAKVDAVLGAPAPAAPRVPESLGCVDWFEYETPGQVPDRT